MNPPAWKWLVLSAAIAGTVVPLAAQGGPPQLTSLNPTTRAVNSNSFPLVVAGQGFCPSSTVFFGQAQLTTQLNSSTQVTATVPFTLLTVPQPVPVTVFNSDATACFNVVRSNALMFTIAATLQIASTSLSDGAVNV